MRSSFGKSFEISDGSVAGCELETLFEPLSLDRLDGPMPQNTFLASLVSSNGRSFLTSMGSGGDRLAFLDFDCESGLVAFCERDPEDTSPVSGSAQRDLALRVDSFLVLGIGMGISGGDRELGYFYTLTWENWYRSCSFAVCVSSQYRSNAGGHCRDCSPAWLGRSCRFWR